MNHRLFEEWILSEEELSPVDNLALREHLDTCPSCQRILEAWKEVDLSLRASHQVAPVAGFVQRCQKRLDAQRVRTYRLRTISLLLFYLGGAALLAGLLGLQTMPLLQFPMPVYLALSYRVATLFAHFELVFELLVTITATLFALVPVTLWIGLSVALGSLVGLWIVTIQKLAFARRIVV